ncbi:DUF4232 domain-containing protein [Streptomyces sp. NBC_00566]|uniref:DUF4232 domain-containing protein n=1 Tax=Streptomyces sp. NBC_00566 TaxID=2975778 RepID=UPI002E80970B|nr:DUF4232 domain-containing protein [Streptomyces sp. NBC_00566]WUB85277.1 DUF4232 domain-containing protein [Streptomyces sp. NBC_00566]
MNASRRTALLSVAASAALTLSLTACQGGEGTKAEGTAAAQTATSPASAPASGTASGTGGSKGAAVGTAHKSDSTGSGSAAAGGSTAAQGTGGSSAATPVCAAKDVKVSAERQDGPPYTHIVLTARNTSGSRCRMAGFPHIQFLESHKQDVPSVAKSKPAAPTVLNPGDPAYALVKLSDGGVDEDNEVVTAFQLVLEGDSTVIAVDSSTGGGLAVDPARTLTGYWTGELRNGADDF